MQNVLKTCLITTLASSLLLTACNGDSSSRSGPAPQPAPGGTDISGNVTAPGGAVAMFTTRHTLLIAIRDAVFARAEAAISGLMPVEGALVELIEVDDQGQQSGAVLATGTTSVSGDYTLTIPAGIDLAGNLIVRISGSGGTEMRAQVVEQQVDINPVTEFVLQKFVDQGADLDNLQTASVVKLTGQVEAFDLTAGADLGAMLAALESETGNFVENQIAVIESTPGDGTALAGSYRLLSLGMGLHDDDQQYGVGTVSVDGEIIDIALSADSAGSVTLSYGAEESFYANQTFLNSNYVLTFNAETDIDGDDTDSATIDNEGVLSIELAFEEDIDGDFGWRSPPQLARFQTANNDTLLVGTQAEASVRYRTVDTNNDDIKDAVDPNAREGDEAFRLLDIVARLPAAMTIADLSGDFGRIYLETELDSGGGLNVRTERNTLSFDGIGSVDVSAAQISDLNRAGYTASTDAAAVGLAYSVAADGKTITVDGDDQDAAVSSGFDFFAMSAVDVTDDANTTDAVVNAVNVGTTLAVKLPSSMPIISSKVYRVFFIGVSVSATSTGLATGRFDSLLTVNSDGVSGSISYELLDIEKAAISAEVVAEDDSPVTQDATINVAANGAASIVVNDPDGAFNLDGYFSEDAGLGLFTSRYADTNEDPDELGVVILVELDTP